MKRILVIRLGAMGDFALSFRAFAAIRAHHATDQVTLLTTAPFVSLALDSPWFDRVLTDTRPPWLDLPRVWHLRRQLRGYDFTYDLQTSSRSNRYFLLAGRPPWSGVARGCSHPHANPDRNNLHTIERQREQLAHAGIHDIARPDLAWLAGRGPVLPAPYALLVPGTSPTHGGAKRWPTERFAEIARLLSARGLVPVVLGGHGDREAAEAIRGACPKALDLTGKTSIQDVAGLASRAALAIGGDTGPIHLAALMGCRVLALYSRFSDPALSAPVGDVRLLQAPALADLPLAQVAAALPGQ